VGLHGPRQRAGLLDPAYAFQLGGREVQVILVAQQHHGDDAHERHRREDEQQRQLGTESQLPHGPHAGLEQLLSAHG
jgi:hypothetical protein